MSPRQFGKVDVSAAWSCPRCPHKHGPHAPCPPSGTCLVLHFCPACDERKQLYCFTHRDRHMPVLPAVLPDLIGPDVQRLAAGEDGDDW